MQTYWTLVRRELGGFFFSWTGYVVIAAVLLIVGMVFLQLLHVLNGEGLDQPLTGLFYSTWPFWAILLFASPLITMRTFAHEKATGTYETLMTTPVTDLQVVLAKFSGALLFYVVMCLPLLAWLLVVGQYTNHESAADFRTVGALLLGILLWGCLCTSLGCLASSLSRNQVIAAVLSFAGGICVWLVAYFARNIATTADLKGQILKYLSLHDYMQDFARGIIDTRPIAFYLSVTVFFLFLNLKVVESRRWK